MTSLSFIIGCWVAGFSVLVALGLLGFGVWKVRWAAYDPYEFRWAWVVIGAVALVATVGFTALGMYPYDMQYHRYRHVTGTVDSVQSRFVGKDGATDEAFAVRLSDGGTYRCDDSRCSLLKAGDRLALWCIREWQYAATSGWVCNFDHSEGGDAK